MSSLHSNLARTALLLSLFLLASACGSTYRAESEPHSPPISTALQPTRAPTATETLFHTTTSLPTEPPTPTETPAPTWTPLPISHSPTTVTPTATEDQVTFIDEYAAIASAALDFGELGTPPPLPSPVRLGALLPTVAPGDLADFAIPPLQIWNGDKKKPRVALTFDTGQAAPVVRQVLEALRPLNVHATFFLVGNWAEKNGNLVRALVADKHELANHSYSHPNFGTLSDAQILAQIMTTEKIVQNLTGCTTRPYFRPPFGAQNKHIQQIVASAGFHNVLWTAHGGDWLPGATAESVHRRVVQNTGNGTILILHSSVSWTAEAIPLIVSDLRARGLEVGTLTELLTTDPARPYRAPCSLK